MPLSFPAARSASKTKLIARCAAAALLAGATSLACAQAAGSNVITSGWLHFEPRTSSDPFVMTSPLNQVLPGTGAKVHNTNTLSLAYERYVTDNWGIKFAGGWPLANKIEGTDTLAGFGELGQADQYSPTLLAVYHFGEAKSTLRPYFGLGFNRTWFRNAKITNAAFSATVFGPGASTNVSIEPTWNPVANAGVNYRFNDTWSLGFSLTYLPLKAKATVSSSTVTVQDQLKSQGIASDLFVGYSF